MATLPLFNEVGLIHDLEHRVGGKHHRDARVDPSKGLLSRDLRDRTTKCVMTSAEPKLEDQATAFLVMANRPPLQTARGRTSEAR